MTKNRKKTYENLKAAAIRRNRRASRLARDIGFIPPVENPERRKRALADFRFFCRAYFPDRFTMPFSPDHDRVAVKVQTAVTIGGKFAFAMPRGRGKTTICEVAALWATMSGRTDFAMLIASEKPAAESTLSNIKAELQNNPRLAADFPEVCYPIAELEGEARRAGGQLHHSVSTSIVWTTNKITLPTIPGSAASGAVIRTAGILGNIRGAQHITPDGRSIRPDLVIIDDPQTDQSANSPSQCAERLRTIQGAILGLAGPGRTLAALLPCTIIRPDDLAAQILDTDANPDWQGERFKQLKAFPTNMALWEHYDQLRRDDLANDLSTLPTARQYYIDNREAMDAGAIVDWPEAVEPLDASAIESTMRLYLADAYAFACERQNDPPTDNPDAADYKTPAELAAAVGDQVRGIVPEFAEKIVAAIDVQKNLLYYGVAAVATDFTGQVITYGAWPDQNRTYYTLARAAPTLGTEYPGKYEARLFAALSDVLDYLAGRKWKREAGGVDYLDRCLIDANWRASTDTIYAFARQSKYGNVLTPCHGRYHGAASRGINDRKKHKGDIVGQYWRSPAVSRNQPTRYVAFDSNYWKTFFHERFAQADNDPGNWRLYHARPTRHRMFADQCHAERPLDIAADGRHVVEWRLPPNKPDNHFFDVGVMLAVAASTQGAVLAEHRAIIRQKRKPRKRKARKL